jgi:hypothetical protein
VTLASLQSEDLALQKAFPRRKNFSFTKDPEQGLR